MAEKKQHIPNFMQPISGVTWFTPEQCRDCLFRDRTSYQQDGKTIECGWHKSCCEIYPYPQMKPDEVYQDPGECEYYEKDKRRKQQETKHHE